MKLLLTATVFTLFLTSATLAQKRLADRDVEGFKGEIKAVTTEDADLKNETRRWVEGKRNPASYVTYGPDGNRVIEKIYEGGRLTSSGVYSLLNGERVLIPDDTGIDPSSTDITVFVPSKEKPKPRDERYSEKYLYKYDPKGARREEIIYENDGTYWGRKVVTLEANQREERVYDEKGGLNQKYVYVLDDKGNEVEMRAFGPRDKTPSWKETYNNLGFDSKGNWIKRIISRLYNRDGKFILTSTTVSYRAITYY